MILLSEGKTKMLFSSDDSHSSSAPLFLHMKKAGLPMKKLILNACSYLRVVPTLPKGHIHYSYSRSRGYKIFSCSTWLSIKFILLINVKMSHLVADDLSLKKYIN